MNSEYILLEDGMEVLLDDINPCVGYIPEHKVTGTPPPLTVKFKIFGESALLTHMFQLGTMYDDFNMDDYYWSPVYLSEVIEMETGFIIEYDMIDQLKKGDYFM